MRRLNPYVWLVVWAPLAGALRMSPSGATVRGARLPLSARLQRKTKSVGAITNEELFLEAMQNSVGDRIVAVKFYASWCRACKTIAPKFERLAKEFEGDAGFYEIEFGANKELCRRLAIKKLPCVQFFQGSEGCVDTVMCGPSKFPDVRVRLEELLGEHKPHPADAPEYTEVGKFYNSTDIPP